MHEYQQTVGTESIKVTGPINVKGAVNIKDLARRLPVYYFNPDFGLCADPYGDFDKYFKEKYLNEERKDGSEIQTQH